jgi:hypothetical protein
VSIEEPHIAMPKLYGAPAYGRPPVPIEATSRPFDPDELPIEADQTLEEREFSSTLPARAYAPGGIDLGRSNSTDVSSNGDLRPRMLSLRSIAGRILGGT